MIRRTLLIAALLVLGLGAPQARAAISLGELIDTDGTIQVGDKLFSDFGYAPSPLGNAPDADDILVDEIPPSGTDPFGNIGIRFNLAGFDDPGDEIATDFTITFSVETTDSAFLITDAVLSSNLAVSGDPGDDDNPFGQITETITAAGVGLIAVLQNFADKNSSDLQDSTTFDPPGPYQKIFVTKDVILRSDGDGFVTVSVIDQSFSQTVIPEPSSVVLGGLGLLCGLGYAWRRRKANA